MAGPTQKTLKRLFALSGNLCAFPGCSQKIADFATDAVVGEVCHIKARSRKGPRFDPLLTEKERNGLENLILLCPIHHTYIDSTPGIYPAKILIDMKAAHEAAACRDELASDERIAKLLLQKYSQSTITENSGNIAINSQDVVQIGNLNIKTGSRKKISIQPPTGTVGADINAARYVSYLVKRYNEFASKDTSRATKFSFAAISRNIESSFGSEWRLLPLNIFDALCEYLHGRINKTRIAKMNRGRGTKSFSTFSEFLSKHG
ncbi:MAG: HNH endonuclease [Rhodospirillales bacterium]|nr:HNH endonuclease [Rhodospirillales bacterium]